MGGMGCGGNFKGHLIERFYASTRPGPGGCLIWTGSKNRDGYGTIIHHGKYLLAHRVAWEILHGAPPRDLVCHRCDVRACVRGAHLFDGSPLMNTTDMMFKARQAKGTKIGNAKLTEQDVGDIKRMRAKGFTYAWLAKAYGVSPGAIQSIAVGRTWRHVT